MTNLNLKNIIKALIGFTFICYFIWMRFIRERLPKDIPYNLTLFTLLILLIIISIYLYILLRLWRPKVPSEIVLNILQILSKLFHPPLLAFDKFVKNKFDFFTKFTLYFTPIIKTFKLYTGDKNYYLYFILVIIPRLILLFIFVLDIFYFNKIELFYYFIFLGIIPLVFSYIIYSLKQQLELWLELLDRTFDIKILSPFRHGNKDFMCYVSHFKYKNENEIFPGDLENLVLSTRYFIDRQADNLLFDYKDLYEYTWIETFVARHEYCAKHNIEVPNLRVFMHQYDEISKAISKKYGSLIDEAVYLHAFLQDFVGLILPDETVKYWNTFILSIYLICWSYILLGSLHAFNIVELITFLTMWSDFTDPFSMLSLEDYR